MYLVMDLVPGTSLKSLVGDSKFEEGKAKTIFRQLLQALEYLQTMGICHRDINPNNIIIEGEKLTLIDFNVAKKFGEPGGNRLMMMTNTGTPKYQAPEMLQGHQCHYDERIDTWSAGSVLYYMLAGEHAFNQEDQKDIENAITLGLFAENPEFHAISSSGKDLIKKLMTVEPE